jgi:hypothetical protein
MNCQFYRLSPKVLVDRLRRRKLISYLFRRCDGQTWQEISLPYPTGT